MSTPKIETISTRQIPSYGRRNYRYNRIETDSRHLYIGDFDPGFSPRTTTNGWVSVRLLHGRGLTFFAVDKVFVNDDRFGGLAWFQPFFFTANIIVKEENDIATSIFADLSFGNRFQITFKSSGFVRGFADGSQIFKCTIRGPRHLIRLATGSARWYNDNRIALKLYHHTKPGFAASIASSQLRTSSRNIIGNKFVKNYGYAYVTALDKISTVDDLAMIAMADAGLVQYRIDPKPAGAENLVSSEIYKQGVDDRSAAVTVEVDAAHLVPAHLWKHDGQPTYYEVFQPFNYRVSLNPGSQLALSPELVDESLLKPHYFALLANTNDPDKIVTPLTEENADLLKVETASSTDLNTFWFEHSNQNRYDELIVEEQDLVN